jgi:hypothetical protein
MTPTLESIFGACLTKWPVLENRIPCLEHVIHLALGPFMSSLNVTGCTKSWEAHECDQEFGEDQSTEIGKSQRLWKQGNARINKVAAMRPGLAKIIEKVCISTYFESAKTDLHIAPNASCLDHAHSWSSKQVHWLSKSQSLHHNTIDWGYKDRLGLDTGVAWASLSITRIHS